MYTLKQLCIIFYSAHFSQYVQYFLRFCLPNWTSLVSFHWLTIMFLLFEQCTMHAILSALEHFMLFSRCEWWPSSWKNVGPKTPLPGSLLSGKATLVLVYPPQFLTSIGNQCSVSVTRIQILGYVLWMTDPDPILFHRWLLSCRKK